MDFIILKEEHTDFGVYCAVLFSATLSLGPDTPLPLFFGNGVWPCSMILDML
jgi:hypothetical protein